MPVLPAQAQFAWGTPLDPAEVQPFTFGWDAELAATGASISTDNWTLSSAAVAAGIEIQLQTNDLTKSTVWLRVDALNQSDPIFDPPGTDFTIKITMTDSEGRTYERTVKFTVGQQ